LLVPLLCDLMKATLTNNENHLKIGLVFKECMCECVCDSKP